MIRNSYDISALLARSDQWRAEARRATHPAMRSLCLDEAARCERMVQRSIEVPVLKAPSVDRLVLAPMSSRLMESNRSE